MSNLFAQLSGRKGDAINIAELCASPAMSDLLECVARGALVSFSTTRDGGALGVMVMYDGEQAKQYFSVTDDVSDWAKEVLAAIPEERPASPTRGRLKGR